MKIARPVCGRQLFGDVVAVPRVAGAESLRGAARSAPGGSQARPAPRPCSLAALVAPAAVPVVDDFQRAGRGAHRGVASDAPEQHGAGHRVVRRARALQPRAERGVAGAARGARVVPPAEDAGALHAALLPVQDVRLQVPVLLLRAQAPQELPRGGDRRRAARPRALHQRVSERCAGGVDDTNVLGQILNVCS